MSKPAKKVAASKVATKKAPAKKVVDVKSTSKAKPVEKAPAVAKVAAAAPAVSAGGYTPVTHYRDRAWEFLSGTKATALHPEADKEVVLHKFRWGVIKRFAITKGKPIIRKASDMALPEKPAYEWLEKNKFIRAQDSENGVYALSKKGKEIYDLFFHNKEPKSYA